MLKHEIHRMLKHDIHRMLKDDANEISKVDFDLIVVNFYHRRRNVSPDEYSSNVELMY